MSETRKPLAGLKVVDVARCRAAFAKKGSTVPEFDVVGFACVRTVAGSDNKLESNSFPTVERS